MQKQETWKKAEEVVIVKIPHFGAVKIILAILFLFLPGMILMGIVHYSNLKKYESKKEDLRNQGYIKQIESD